MTALAAVTPSPDDGRCENAEQRQRELLVRRLADLLFLPSGQIARPEKMLVDEILSRLTVTLDYGMRLRIARRISTLAEPPRHLGQLIAADEPEIARLVLARPDLFDDADLVAFVKSTSREHHLIIAARPSLGPSVSEALVACGDPAVVEVLLCNSSASLSWPVYRYLAELSHDNTKLQALILARSDVPAAIAHEMFWFVGADLRLAILHRFHTGRRLLVDALADIRDVAEPFGDVEWALRMAGPLRPTPKTQGVDASALAHWLTSPGDQEAIALIASAMAVTPVTVRRIGEDQGGEAIIVFAKATGISGAEVRTLGPALIHCIVDAERLESLFGLFDALSTDWADLLVRLWDQQHVGT